MRFLGGDYRTWIYHLDERNISQRVVVNNQEGLEEMVVTVTVHLEFKVPRAEVTQTGEEEEEGHV